ncbi:unnamed protein product [Ilex paraguariensis]|uniref:Uncharacterized protein n=1 Tax=Ilex paraguariensis TaxID=185542 RepID=A0ABC8R9F8_9AQUA
MTALNKKSELPANLRTSFQKETPYSPSHRYCHFTSLNTSLGHVLNQIQATEKLRWPKKLKGNRKKRDQTKFCAFH